MIKVIAAHYTGDVRVALEFSDDIVGEFSGCTLLQRNGPLLEPLRDEAHFSRCFVDTGALCRPNDLELSLTRIARECASA